MYRSVSVLLPLILGCSISFLFYASAEKKRRKKKTNQRYGTVEEIYQDWGNGGKSENNSSIASQTLNNLPVKSLFSPLQLCCNLPTG
jgi:hypothetical protein